LKIALYLLTEKGYQVLQSVVKHQFKGLIEQVIIGSDQHVANDYASEIKRLCIQENIVYSLRDDGYTLTAEYAIAVSWRWIIRRPDLKLIVLHDSLLPKYRGFAPLVNALLNKESQVGVTALFASDYYDEGEIIAQHALPVKHPVRIESVIQNIIPLYAQLAIDIFTKIKAGETIKSYPQNDNEATYSLWRNEHDYLIDWNKNAADILNFIYAVSSPYKGAATFIQATQKIRILDALIEKDVQIINRDAGKVIFVRNQFPVIVCGKGLLKITKAIDDKTGKSVLPFKKFRTRLVLVPLSVQMPCKRFKSQRHNRHNHCNRGYFGILGFSWRANRKLPKSINW